MFKRNRYFILFGLHASQRSLKGLSLLFLVYFGAILFAAITASWVYKLVIWWAENYPNDTNQYLYRKGFEDYFDRLRWIPVVGERVGCKERRKLVRHGDGRHNLS